MKIFVFASFLLAIYINAASGTRFTISPRDTVTIGLGSTTELLTFECKPELLIEGKPINSIAVIRLSMQRSNEAEVGLVVIDTTKPVQYTPDAPNNFQGRTEISGAIASGTDLIANSYLKFTMNESLVHCDDMASYKCSITYLDELYKPVIDDVVANFTTKANPTALVLTALKDGRGVEGGDSASNKAEFNVGTIATFTCTGDIGSDNTMKIKWQVSSIGTGAMSLHGDDIQDGVVSSSPNNCQYSLTSRMTYNITKFDATRGSGNDMRIQCYLDKAVNTKSNVYFINPYDPSKAVSGAGTGSSTGSSGEAGVIAGAVVGVVVAIVIVALLVYFLWYRRRNEGDTYNTKEETGASNPNLNTDYTYSVPVKGTTRTGHENRGLDEPHEARHESRHEPRGKYRDADDYEAETHRGRANHGMDGEDDYHSMDGGHGEHINHMGVDPHSGSYGTGV